VGLWPLERKEERDPKKEPKMVSNASEHPAGRLQTLLRCFAQSPTTKINEPMCGGDGDDDRQNCEVNGAFFSFRALSPSWLLVVSLRGTEVRREEQRL
jgi:hypothetical protein